MTYEELLEINNQMLRIQLLELQKKYDELQKERDELEDGIILTETLLSNAHDLMGNTHCYDTDVYYDIMLYFEGEYDLVGEGSEGFQKLRKRQEEENNEER